MLIPALCSALIRSIAERDFSAQETAHQLLSLTLFSCSFNFVALSLNGGSLLTTDNYSREHKIEKSLLQHYETHTSLYKFSPNHTIQSMFHILHASSAELNNISLNLKTVTVKMNHIQQNSMKNACTFVIRTTITQ